MGGGERKKERDVTDARDLTLEERGYKYCSKVRQMNE